MSDLNLTEIHCPMSQMTRLRISLYLQRRGGEMRGGGRGETGETAMLLDRTVQILF